MGSVLGRLQRSYPRLQRLDLFTRALQHRLLDLEFFTGDQVQPTQRGLEAGAQVALQIVLKGLESARPKTRKAPALCPSSQVAPK